MSVSTAAIMTSQHYRFVTVYSFFGNFLGTPGPRCIAFAKQTAGGPLRTLGIYWRPFLAGQRHKNQKLKRKM
jgi:hypothetical protein